VGVDAFLARLPVTFSWTPPTPVVTPADGGVASPPLLDAGAESLLPDAGHPSPLGMDVGTRAAASEAG
jgi:hypothetical protein